MWQEVLLLGSLVGGWAAITVRELPDYVVAGEPVTLTFVVRQHGVTRLSGLHPSVQARAGAAVLDAVVKPGHDAGEYDATLTPLSAGAWTITIHSGFGTSQVTLLPLRAIAAGAPAPTGVPAPERGRQLFVAKGCVTCHVHRDVEGSGRVAVGPELSDRRLPLDYLKAFLANPGIAPVTGAFRMPNLELKEPEIAALAAFLSAERQALR